MPVPEERLEFYCESQNHLKPPPPSLERMNDGQREDQGIIIHYSMRRFGPKPREEGENTSPVPTFGSLFVSEMVFGNPKPDLFSLAISER